MATEALVRRGGDPSRDEVIGALTGHVCRCTGYVKIVDAAMAAVAGDVDPPEAEADLGPQGEDAVTVIPGRWG
jgi:xanthine dehydrogenase iron-sulfur cluster and FAD-binding subunit A